VHDFYRQGNTAYRWYRVFRPLLTGQADKLIPHADAACGHVTTIVGDDRRTQRYWPTAIVADHTIRHEVPGPGLEVVERLHSPLSHGDNTLSHAAQTFICRNSTFFRTSYSYLHDCRYCMLFKVQTRSPLFAMPQTIRNSQHSTSSLRSVKDE